MNFELTPIQERGEYLFKREDYFAPFPFCGVNGGKLRQCLLLVEKNKGRASAGIVTATSILSPQAVIASAAAKSIGAPCLIMYGGTSPQRLAAMEYPRICSALGAEIRIVAATGRTSAINAKAAEYARQTGGYNIRYGFDMRGNLDCFLQSVAEQVQNIPDHIENLVVTVGSAITVVGILYGLKIYGKRVDNVWGIGVAPNREGKIHEYAAMLSDAGLASDITKPLRYIDAFAQYKGFKYEDKFEARYHGIRFHPRYEAKAFRWLRYAKPRGGVLFWITGAELTMDTRTIN